MERARQLSPHLFPEDPKVDNAKLRTQVQYLAERLAKAEGKPIKEILESSDAALGKMAPSKPENQTPQTSEKNAKFFGHTKKDVYYPIEMRANVPYKNMKPENIRFFKDEAEAKEASYKPAE